MATRILQTISGTLLGFWIILIGLAQVNCSIIPAFGERCSFGEGDVWLLPFMYLPIGGITLLVLILSIYAYRHSPPSKALPNVADASLPVALIAGRASETDVFTLSQENLWRPKQAAGTGGIMTLIVLVSSMLLTNQPVTLMGLFLSVCFFLVPLFLPTFFLYAPLAACILRLKTKPNANAGLALVVALIPFGLWVVALKSGLTAKANERAAIAAIPKSDFPKKIGGIVIDGADWPMINCARKFMLTGEHSFPEVFTQGQSTSPYLRFTKADWNSPVHEGQAADTVPGDLLLIHFPRRSKFLRDRVVADIRFPSVEIYSVDPESKKLVALTYASDEQPPAFPPVLTPWGWYRGDRSTTPEMQCKNIRQFLHRELMDKLP